MISLGGTRRGVRLEDGFWNALAEIAAHEGKRANAIIGEYAERYVNLGNLTAAIRLGILEDIRKHHKLRPGASDLIIGLVAASPTASFAISGNKRIITYNAAFLTLLQARLSHVASESLSASMKLQLETPLETLMTQLKASPRSPVSTTYAIAMQDRVVKGRVNTVLADPSGQGAIIGFILN
ncbi:ribbon-helix-helix domain-containing protein [Rhizobium sp. PAMB 3182]